MLLQTSSSLLYAVRTPIFNNPERASSATGKKTKTKQKNGIKYCKSLPSFCVGLVGVVYVGVSITKETNVGHFQYY